MNSILLGVNIDHVATLRQARGTPYPDLGLAASMVTAAGADSITLHLREDRRHIQDHDVAMLSSLLTVPMNLELAITEEMLAIAEMTRPQYCCFVPERREELTTEGGLDVITNIERVRQAVLRMENAGIRASVFTDPDLDQIQAVADCGAGAVEIHTGSFADAANGLSRGQELAKIEKAAEQASALGLLVNAGHGLNYDNVHEIAGLMTVQELNIGHAIVARAVFIGLDRAVMEMRTIMNEARTEAR